MTTTEPGLRGFMSPFEVPAPDGCEGWEAMYPYYALFSDERRDSEEARGWFRDGMHFPEPMFPFDFVTADSPYMCLGQANSRIFAVPPALGIDHRVLYGWVYMSANPVTDPEEIGRRAELFGRRAGFYFQNWDELYGRWRTKVQETIDELAALEVPDLPDIEDEAVVTEGRGIGSTHTLLVAYNRLLESIDRIWQYHFEFLNLGYAAYLVFYELCKQSFPDIADQAIAKMVSGIDVVLFRPDNELKRLAGRALELSIADDVAAAETEDSLTQSLSASAAGREWLSDWESVKQPWFHYSNGNGFYHHHRSWSDDAAVPLAHLSNYIRRLQAGEDISRPLDAGHGRARSHHRRLPRAARRRGRHRIRPEPRARPDGVPVRREPQLLRRALVPHGLLEQGPRVRRAARAPRLPRRPGGHLLPAAQRGLRRARGPAACVGCRIGGSRHAATGRRSWRGASRSWTRCAASRRRPRSARCPRRSPSR